MYGIMAVHEGHAYIGMVEGLPREISEVIHHTYGCIGLSGRHQSTLHRPLHYILYQYRSAECLVLYWSCLFSSCKGCQAQALQSCNVRRYPLYLTYFISGCERILHLP